jgi:hypothetical protein
MPRRIEGVNIVVIKLKTVRIVALFMKVNKGHEKGIIEFK